MVSSLWSMDGSEIIYKQAKNAKENMEVFNCAYTDILEIKELTPHPKNRNKHPKDQIERLAKLIEYQGQRHPIIISTLSGHIVAGHGRLMAIKHLKWKSVAVDYQDFENEEQEYLFIQSDNAIALWAELDLAGINADLGSEGPFDIDLLGIKDFTIEPLDKIDPLTDQDEVPEIKDHITKRGDVWLLGNHRVMCGDSTMIDEVEKLMNGEKADMVFTDPPYGVSFQSNMRTKSKKFDVIKNDDSFISEWVNHLPLFSNGWVFVWTTWKVIKEWIDICAPIGDLSNVVIWDKGGGGIGDLSKTFSTDYEIALVYHRGAEITGKRIGSVWSIGKDKAIDYKHPTQKPVELATTALENCTINSSIILDLFLGSGSTLIACEKTNRKCFGMELDEHYCDVIINRWQNYTGKEAILESSGQKYNDLANKPVKEENIKKRKKNGKAA